jgi:N-acetylglucosamine kinase
MWLWGLDLGGTKIEGVVLDPAKPAEPVCRLRLPTGAANGYGHVLDQIEQVVRAMEEASGQSCPDIFGIGTPGAIDPSTNTLKNSNTVCLNGRPLKEDLTKRLKTDIRLANDANCFALAEATLGAAAGEDVVFGVILGTGVGGGIVVRGQILEGRHGIAGEWGHNPLCGESTPCYCGRAGCVETVLAGPSLERFHRESTGESLRLPEILSGPDAAPILLRLREKFGEAIAAVINILDPDAIVIGGGVGNIPALYEPETREAILRHTFNPELRTKILKPTLGDSAGVFGAAMLTNQEDWNKSSPPRVA